MKVLRDAGGSDAQQILYGVLPLDLGQAGVARTRGDLVRGIDHDRVGVVGVVDGTAGGAGVDPGGQHVGVVGGQRREAGWGHDRARPACGQMLIHDLQPQVAGQVITGLDQIQRRAQRGTPNTGGELSQVQPPQRPGVVAGQTGVVDDLLRVGAGGVRVRICIRIRIRIGVGIRVRIGVGIRIRVCVRVGVGVGIRIGVCVRFGGRQSAPSEIQRSIVA